MHQTGNISISFIIWSDIQRKSWHLLRCILEWISLVWKVRFNPYLQILENSSRNFSEIFIFRVVRQAWPLLENSSIKNHDYLFSFFQSSGVTQAVLLENSPIRIFDWNNIWYVTFDLDEFSSKMAWVATLKMKISEKFLDESSMICQ